jgi:hypothetical protein
MEFSAVDKTIIDHAYILIRLSEKKFKSIGERARWVAEMLVKVYPELAGWKIRIYDWALHTIAKRGMVFPFPHTQQGSVKLK